MHTVTLESLVSFWPLFLLCLSLHVCRHVNTVSSSCGVKTHHVRCVSVCNINSWWWWTHNLNLLLTFCFLKIGVKNSAVASCEGFVSVFQLKMSWEENGSKGQTRQEMLEYVRLMEINVGMMSCRDVGAGLITTWGRVLVAGGCCYPVVPLIRKLSHSVDLAFLPGCSCFFSTASVASV